MLLSSLLWYTNVHATVHATPLLSTGHTALSSSLQLPCYLDCYGPWCHLILLNCIRRTSHPFFFYSPCYFPSSPSISLIHHTPHFHSHHTPYTVPLSAPQIKVGYIFILLFLPKFYYYISHPILFLIFPCPPAACTRHVYPLQPHANPHLGPCTVIQEKAPWYFISHSTQVTLIPRPRCFIFVLFYGLQHRFKKKK